MGQPSNVGCVIPQTINHMYNSFPLPDNLLNKVDVLPCQGRERLSQPSFSPPLNKQLNVLIACS